MGGVSVPPTYAAPPLGHETLRGSPCSKAPMLRASVASHSRDQEDQRPPAFCSG